MKRVGIAGIGIVALLLAFLAYATLKPTEQASGPIEAIPIEIATEPTIATTEAPTAPAATATEQSSAPATSEPEAAPTEAVAPTAAAAPTIFEIEQESSQARFIIDEVLRGAPTTVVGTTNQVAGQIAVNPADPSTTQVGTIQVNARTFVTPESRRDRALQNMILQTNQYEYVTFTPTSLVGLPEAAAVGQPYSFQIVGDLTIRDATQQVTWDVTVTPLSEEHLQGTASTIIRYADWGLNIPNVPVVADVSDEVRLELDWVAKAQS